MNEVEYIEHDARKYLRIGETLYRLESLAIDTRLVRRAFRLHRGLGVTYDVSEHHSGRLECTCGDGTFHPEKRCKHSRALKQVGLIGGNREYNVEVNVSEADDSGRDDSALRS